MTIYTKAGVVAEEEVEKLLTPFAKFTPRLIRWETRCFAAVTPPPAVAAVVRRPPVVTAGSTAKGRKSLMETHVQRYTVVVCQQKLTCLLLWRRKLW